MLFSREPDYFEGEYVNGVVSKATFSVKEKHPVLQVRYKAGSEEFTYTSYRWYLRRYRRGETVTMIYNPSHPEAASIYAFVGYWILWKQLFYTAIIFIMLFVAAKSITGQHKSSLLDDKQNDRKRKYDD